jgi:hypothetical protein
MALQPLLRKAKFLKLNFFLSFYRFFGVERARQFLHAQVAFTRIVVERGTTLYRYDKERIAD